MSARPDPRRPTVALPGRCHPGRSRRQLWPAEANGDIGGEVNDVGVAGPPCPQGAVQPAVDERHGPPPEVERVAGERAQAPSSPLVYDPEGSKETS